MNWRLSLLAATAALAVAVPPAAQPPAARPAAQQGATGSVRGVVYDRDFDAPLAGAEVSILELGAQARVTTAERGNYLIPDVPPGTYTVVFRKENYVNQVRGEVVVSAGQLTEIDVYLAVDFYELEEFVVQDILQLGPGTEAALLELRFESPALLDSISADLISRAGASDAASALNLVAGATVQDGKFAVVRGLPDRYVSSQLNGVRLPTADENKRAVELDQFPTAVLESIQVSKTFTPNQQGDASGGAVDVRLRGLPEQGLFQIQAGTSFNTEVFGRDDFRTYDGGGVGFFADESRRPQAVPSVWEGALGTIEDDSPIEQKYATAFGGQKTYENGVTLGGFASFFHQRDASVRGGFEDQLWVTDAGGPLVPQTTQGVPSPSGFGDDFKTQLFDIERGVEEVKYGGLGIVALKTDDHALDLTYLYSRSGEDVATFAQDTRGKEFFYPGHDPDDPTTPGHAQTDDALNAAPYVRLQTLSYTERTTDSLQLAGSHVLPFESADGRSPELNWSLSHNTAKLDQPDKRVFGSLWQPGRSFMGIPLVPEQHLPFKPAANFSLGNIQRIFKSIEETDSQLSMDLEWPVDVFGREDSTLTMGVFVDDLTREFRQDTFSNPNDNGARLEAGFDVFWSAVWPQGINTNGIIGESNEDADYDGDQDIWAVYSMLQVPVTDELTVIGGARLESTKLATENFPDPGQAAVYFDANQELPLSFEDNPDGANTDFSDQNVLPALALIYEPNDKVKVRTAVSRTIARQTFKELSPLIQQEFAGGPVFVGNQDLELAKLTNFDLRLDYTPYEGGFFSASWFFKDIEDAIENAQELGNGFTFTRPRNYPEGELSGFEVEARQDLGHYTPSLEGLSVGANATFINSSVRVTDAEAARFATFGYPITRRDASNAPEHLYNLYLTYDLADLGTQLSLFYTVRGDTLIAGAGTDGANFTPDIYQKEFGTLNFGLRQNFGDHWRLSLGARNLTNPDIEEFYSSGFLPDGDVTRVSFKRGVDYSISLGFSL